MTAASLDGQPLRGLWSALDSRVGDTTMTLTTHIPDPPVSWYGTPDDPGPLATWRALSDYQRDVARRLGLTAAKARRMWGVQ